MPHFIGKCPDFVQCFHKYISETDSYKEIVPLCINNSPQVCVRQVSTLVPLENYGGYIEDIALES